ncbi:MAG: RluA family pseudouridine synthase [Burkholderiaceae bacterium]|jgi:23S rRNA pseudouridine955/2504/2580 synthase|nr:RluA family pseudouridine synthase [Burkholderiaceae bacterium]
MPANSIISAPTASRIVVEEESAGQRLDNFLLRHLKGVPKTHIYRIIRDGQVRVNKGRAAADTRLAEGDQVRVPPLRLPDAAARKAELPAPAREFPILLEDEHLLAIDKPAGVAVHGGSGVSFGVIEQLRQARPQARFLELAHRLDRETSGVLLIAKKPGALKDVQRQLRERRVGKTYLALALGVWPDNLKVIDAPLARYLLKKPLPLPRMEDGKKHPSLPLAEEGKKPLSLPRAGEGWGEGHREGERRVRVAHPDDPAGQRAVTLVKVLERLPETTLLAVTIKTGRTHQIRVHLAAQGHPIAGDDKYGDFARNKALQKQGLKRMFLHAWRLRLVHPASGQTLELTAPPPPDLLPFLTPSPASGGGLGWGCTALQ